MRYVEKEYYIEIHPENREEVDALRCEFTHIWPFEFVCVSNKPDQAASLKRPINPWDIR